MWTTRFLASSRGQIVSLLRRAGRTVEELAGLLGLTPNAVRAQLSVLERDGLVQQAGLRRGTRKPHATYELTTAAEALFPKAYAPVLRVLLDVLDDRGDPQATDALLREVGRRLAAGHAAALHGLPPAARLDKAVELLNQLGGLAEVRAPATEAGAEAADPAHAADTAGAAPVEVRGYSCPFAAMVAGHPQVCRLAETLLSELVGLPVVERCDKGPSPRCRFHVGAEPGAPEAR